LFLLHDLCFYNLEQLTIHFLSMTATNFMSREIISKLLFLTFQVFSGIFQSGYIHA
jgi:hypothetical protein